MCIAYTLCPVILNRKGVGGIAFGTPVMIVDVKRYHRRGFIPAKWQRVKPTGMRAGDRVTVRTVADPAREAEVLAQDLVAIPPSKDTP